MRQNVSVRVISLKMLREFWTRHPDAQEPLRHWYVIAAAAQWASLTDVRRTFGHADGVRTANGETLTVFNVSGNKYRLIVLIRYDYQLINIRVVLTHADYVKGHWKRM